MTPEEVRKKLINQARADLGLNDTPTSWTYEQRNAYIKRLAFLIEANADLLPAAEVAAAVEIGNKVLPPLEDTSFDWGMFADEFAANAVPTLKTANRTLAAVAAVGAVLIALWFVITTRPVRA